MDPSHEACASRRRGAPITKSGSVKRGELGPRLSALMPAPGATSSKLANAVGVARIAVVSNPEPTQYEFSADEYEEHAAAALYNALNDRPATLSLVGDVREASVYWTPDVARASM